MGVYKIHADHENFMSFFVEGYELRAKMGADITFHIDATPASITDIWQTPDVSFYTPNEFPKATTIPDITNWGPSELIVNEKVKNSINFEEVAEVLTLNCEGIPYYFINVIKSADDTDIDHSRSEQEFEEGYLVDIKALAFHEEKVKDYLIFKSEYDRYRSLFCTDTFKDMIEKAGYKGLKFSTNLISIF